MICSGIYQAGRSELVAHRSTSGSLVRRMRMAGPLPTRSGRRPPFLRTPFEGIPAKSLGSVIRRLVSRTQQP